MESFPRVQARFISSLSDLTEPGARADYEENAKLFDVELIPFLRVDDTRIDEPTENKIRDALVRSMGKQIIVQKITEESLAGKTMIDAKIQI